MRKIFLFSLILLLNFNFNLYSLGKPEYSKYLEYPKYSEYKGPINLNFVIKVYNFAENKEQKLSNSYLYLNNLIKSEQGYGNSLYLKTDENGVINMVMPYQAYNAEYTLYGVNELDSSIMLDCKLAKANNTYSNYFEIPKPESKNSITLELVLRGYSCLRN